MIGGVCVWVWGVIGIAKSGMKNCLVDFSFSFQAGGGKVKSSNLLQANIQTKIYETSGVLGLKFNMKGEWQFSLGLEVSSSRFDREIMKTWKTV
jgi:hypothetical protein